jgi:hypothetical protein
MRYHIEPVVKRLGIHKRVAWHTFRRTYTSLLHANGEDVKVVQELLRHSSSRVTLDVYAQAQMPAKRAAQQKASCGVGKRLNCSPEAPRRKQGICAKSLKRFGVPDGIRTRVTAVKVLRAAVTD